jgi:tellurite resistance protein TerC
MLYLALGGQAALVLGAFLWETHDQRSGQRSVVRRAVIWSVAWLLIGLLPTLIFGLLQDGHAASAYAAVYLIERALSLDNVFVFAVLISAFEIPLPQHDRVVTRGALFAFLLRIPAIFVGVALFNASHLVSYALGALLLVLAWQTVRASGEQKSHGPGRIITALQRRLPVSDPVHPGLVVVHEGRRQVTPMFLCLLAIGLADIAFALDSIPAALAVSDDVLLLLAANLLALLGLRPLFQLVAVARERLRYMDHTIAVLLLFVAVKLLGDELVHVGPLPSLGVIVLVLVTGAAISLGSDVAPT